MVIDYCYLNEKNTNVPLLYPSIRRVPFVWTPVQRAPFHSFTLESKLSWLGRVILAMHYTMDARIEMKYTLHNTPKISQVKGA